MLSSEKVVKDANERLTGERRAEDFQALFNKKALLPT